MPQSRWALENADLDHTSYSHRPNKYFRSFHQFLGTSLRLCNWLSLYVALCCSLFPALIFNRTLTLDLPDGLGYLKFLSPPEKIMRWLEGKLNLLGRVPHYVSLDQKTYGRYGVLPTTNAPSRSGQIPMTYTGSTQRLGP